VIDAPEEIQQWRDPVRAAVADVVRSAPEIVKLVEDQRAHQEYADRLAAVLMALDIPAGGPSPIRDLSMCGPWQQWAKNLESDAGAAAPTI
jgi:hypothetical protein